MVETNIEIGATLDEVWGVLLDVERWPEWTTSMSDVKLLDDGPLAVGAQVRVKQPRLPSTVWKVTSLEPGQAFSWAAAAPGVTTVADHRLVSQSPGRVKVTLAIRRSGPLAPLFDLLLGRVTRRYVAMEAEGLTRRFEAGR